MTDQLHPSTAGQQAEAAFDLLTLLQFVDAGNSAVGSFDAVNPYLPAFAPFDPYLSQMARAQSFTTPWTVYPQACADPDYYILIASGAAGAATQLAPGQTFMDFGWPGPTSSIIIPGIDIIQQASYGCWALTSGATVLNETSTDTRIIGITTPAIIYPQEPINIWRPKYGNVAAENYYLNTVAYPYRRRVMIAGAGTGYVDITTPVLSDPPFNVFGIVNAINSAITSSDTLVLVTNGVVALSSCTFVPSGTNLRCLWSGSHSNLLGDSGWVFGAHNFEGVPSTSGTVSLLPVTTSKSGTSGTAVCSQTFQGTLKIGTCYVSGYAETGVAQTYTFPTAFSVAPVLQTSPAGACDGTGGSYAPMTTASTLTLPANAAMTAETCNIVVMGQ
jgi:hypothetical protein